MKLLKEIPCTAEDSAENKDTTQFGLLENEVGLACSNPTFNKHPLCKNATGKKIRSLRIYWFYLKFLVFFHDICLLNAGLEHPRCNLVFEKCIISFLKCYIVY